MSGSRMGASAASMGQSRHSQQQVNPEAATQNLEQPDVSNSDEAMDSSEGRGPEDVVDDEGNLGGLVDDDDEDDDESPSAKRQRVSSFF